MPKKSVLPLLLISSALTLSIVIFKTEPPKSLNEASLSQLALFFIPLGVFLTLLIKLILKNWAQSAFLALGLILLLFLKSMTFLNSITFFLGVLGLVLTFKIITKPAKPKFHHSLLKEEKPHLLKPLPKVRPPKLSRTIPKPPKPKVKISRMENE